VPLQLITTTSPLLLVDVAHGVVCISSDLLSAAKPPRNKNQSKKQIVNLCIHEAAVVVVVVVVIVTVVIPFAARRTEDERIERPRRINTFLFLSLDTAKGKE